MLISVMYISKRQSGCWKKQKFQPAVAKETAPFGDISCQPSRLPFWGIFVIRDTESAELCTKVPTLSQIISDYRSCARLEQGC